MIGSGRAGPALLMIDYQRAFCDADGSMARQGRDIGGLADALEVGNRVVAAARRRALPVIWTRMVFAQDYSDGGVLTREIRPNLARIGALRRGSGDETLSPACAYDESDVVIDKPRYSALIGTPLEVLLRARGIDTLYVAGVTTPMCVESTVRDLGQRDYAVTVVGDACADFEPARHEASLAAMAFGFARIIDSEALLTREDWAREMP